MKENRQHNQVINCMISNMQESVQAKPVPSSVEQINPVKISRNKIFSTGAIQYTSGFSFLYTEVNQTFQMSK
jgi:hypothetical protein